MKVSMFKLYSFEFLSQGKQWYIIIVIMVILLQWMKIPLCIYCWINDKFYLFTYVKLLFCVQDILFAKVCITIMT